MDFDYSFFDETLARIRRLRARFYPWYIIDAAPEIGTAEQLKKSPKIISTVDDDCGETVLEAASYARQPGNDLSRLQGLLENETPLDFREFYGSYAEALLVTRSYPIHLWTEAKMLEEVVSSRPRLDLQKPIRFFRFGEYYDRHAQQFGLWQEKRGSDIWRVAVTDINTRDEEYDTDEINSVYIMGSSFYDWLKDLVERDGLPDPFFDLGEEGGYIDPV